MSANHWTKKKSNHGRYGLVAGAGPAGLPPGTPMQRDYPLWSELTPRMKVKFNQFLKLLSKSGAINKSRTRAKLGRGSIRTMRRNPEFEQKVMEALEKYVESAEESVDKRAFKGVDDPVYFEGEVVGYRKKYSDALAMFRLRGLAPEKYAEKHQHQHEGTIEHNVKVYIPENRRDPQLAQQLPGPEPAVLDNDTGKPVD